MYKQGGHRRKEGKMLELKQLRHMNAHVLKLDKITCYFTSDYKGGFTIKNPIILQSYDSCVAVYDDNIKRLYLLPDYDYSRTTCKHVHAFIEDYTNLKRSSYKDMRKDAKGEQERYTFIKDILY